MKVLSMRAKGGFSIDRASRATLSHIQRISKLLRTSSALYSYFILLEYLRMTTFMILSLLSLLLSSKRAESLILRHDRVELESRKYSVPNHFRKLGRVQSHEYHNVIFAIHQKNIPFIGELLVNVSKPGHPQYGQHLTRAQVGELTSNSQSTDYVMSYLSNHDVEIKASSLYGEYISVKGKIAVFESMFQTEFYHYHNARNNKTSINADKYTVDRVLKDHISAVFNVIHLPVQHRDLSIRRHDMELMDDQVASPNVLKEQYNIVSMRGSGDVSQAVFSSLENYYSPSDLAQFQETYNIPKQTVSSIGGNRQSDSKCRENINLCAESNLDVQYLTSIAQRTPTFFFYEPQSSNTFISWIYSVSSESNPPLVNSLSYGSYESQLDKSIENSFNTEAMKLGVQGVSIIVSTGDDGAANYFARNDASNCGYNPSFPSTSPYVTAVGSTQGRWSLPEVSSSSRTGGVVTSGGGFSNVFSTPDYQRQAVSRYFDGLTSCPSSGYNCGGRGYPDISFPGLDYAVIIAGQTYLASGTSASAPAVAALISLVNAARVAAGKSSLGLLNYAIYEYGSSFAYDIRSSNNRCTGKPIQLFLYDKLYPKRCFYLRLAQVCCNEGFSCAPGWDPVTGWGSIDFEKFRNIFVQL
jgi:tripeptidyl-peptidase I